MISEQPEKKSSPEIVWSPMPDPFSDKMKENAVKRKGKGRPTKLTRELIDEARDWLDNHTETLISYVEEGRGQKMIKKCQIPTKEALQLWIDISDESLSNYQIIKEEDDEELKALKHDFIGIVKELEIKQRRMLIAGSLDGTFTPQSANFQLAAKHGYIAKTAVEQRTTVAVDTPDFWKEVSNQNTEEK